MEEVGGRRCNFLRYKPESKTEKSAVRVEFKTEQGGIQRGDESK